MANPEQELAGTTPGSTDPLVTRDALTSTEVPLHQPTPPPGAPAGTTAAARSDPLPEEFGRYRILKRLGRGGMGTVYLAHDTQIDRPVALKVPHRDVAEDPEALERFYREARAAGRLQHPHLCPVYDVGTCAGFHYLTMAYIEGRPLAELIASFLPQPRQVATLVRTLALALEEAHRQGIIHRDLKPANIMINQRSEPIVMDFGLARRLQASGATQTSPGMVMGTPAYMAPEQALGDVAAIGPCSDIYSLGVILYQLLSGRVPFEGTVTAVLIQVANTEPSPPSLHRPDLDPCLEAICLKAMAKQAAQRHGSMQQFAEALDAYLRGEHTPSPASAGTSPAGPSVDTRLVDETLDLLRTWGWEKGLEKATSWLSRVKDLSQRANLALLLEWLAGKYELQAEASRRFQGVPQWPALAGWATVGRALVARRGQQFAAVQEVLEQLPVEEDFQDKVLQATIARLRGDLLCYHAQWDQALPLVYQALDQFGPEHFEVGRVLDTLGVIYSGKDNFHAAREFFQQALAWKRRVGDEAGMARSHSELGRLYLRWNQLDRAEEHFQANLKHAQKRRDEFSQAITFSFLGQVALARGEQEATSGRLAAARRHWTRAAEWLDWAIRRSQELQRPVSEGYARTSRALLGVYQEDLALAEEHAQKAEELFQAAQYPRGLAHVQRATGILRQRAGQAEEALERLDAALASFDSLCEHADAAHTQLEIARTLLAAKRPRDLVSEAFLQALERAEVCRRVHLVQTIEEELQAVDPEAHWRHVYGRIRGKGLAEATTSLTSGGSEVATVLFLNLREFALFCQGMDPEEVMITLNQMLADLASVLERYRAQVTAYLGGGFMALLREANHAQRAVHAALDLQEVLAEFNRPRVLLGWRLLPGQIGIASGSVFLGNIGTYHKMDFTAVGAVVNLASRLMRQADTRSPCISRETYEMVREHCVFKSENPQVIELKGIGPREVWEVIGRKKESSSGRFRG